MMNPQNNRKLKKFRLKGVKVNRKKLYFGFYGLVSVETGRIDSKVFKSLTDIVKRKVKIKKGKFWFYLNMTIPVSQSPIGTRMGKGKGNISKYISFVRKGQTVLELNVSNKKDALEILKIASSKLPIKTKIVLY
jgi:large subunit ribosomal protein L16